MAAVASDRDLWWLAFLWTQPTVVANPLTGPEEVGLWRGRPGDLSKNCQNRKKKNSKIKAVKTFLDIICSCLHVSYNIYSVWNDIAIIEDITRWCEDMDFIFEWWKQYFTNERTGLFVWCVLSHTHMSAHAQTNLRVLFVARMKSHIQLKRSCSIQYSSFNPSFLFTSVIFE